MRSARSPRRRSRLAGWTLALGDLEAAGVDVAGPDGPLEELAREHALGGGGGSARTGRTRGAVFGRACTARAKHVTGPRGRPPAGSGCARAQAVDDLGTNVGTRGLRQARSARPQARSVGGRLAPNGPGLPRRPASAGRTDPDDPADKLTGRQISVPARRPGPVPPVPEVPCSTTSSDPARSSTAPAAGAASADVGIRDGRIVAVGRVDEAAEAELDATGLMVAPGVVDPHTHYDAQLFWDPSASPSNVHGVTTVIGGNCGFTLAPINAEDADYIRRMMAKVEGMPLAALENGVPWNWSTFGEYLDALEGGLGVNAGFLVGHCALRRKVMGADRAEEVATDDEIAAMRALLAESLAAGGLGFSSSQSRTHSDGDGRPISSRHADRREMLAFCEEVAAHEGTTLEYITNGCLDSFSPEEIDLMTAMSVTAQRPLNWNVLTVDARSAERIEHQLAASSTAAAAGGRIVALTMPTLVPMNMSFRTHCALFLIPGWGEVMGLPEAERMAQLADPAVRAMLDERARSKEAGVFRGLSHWGTYVIGDTYAPRQRGLRVPHRGRHRGGAGHGPVRHPARHRPGRRPAHRAVAQHRRRRRGHVDHAGRRLGRPAGHGRRLRRRRAPRPDVRLQLPDGLPGRLPARPQARPRREGGAHDDRASRPPSSACASAGSSARGTPPTCSSSTRRRSALNRPASSTTCPGDTPRLYAGSHGVVRVLVNGVETVRDGAPTGRVAGHAPALGPRHRFSRARPPA